MDERADLVILGGGLAGLALAERLARSGAGGRVRILEPREHYVDDRSWAFWTPAGSALASAATRTWTRWRSAVHGGESVTAEADGWRYAYLRSGSVYDAALATIAATPRITLECGVRAGDMRGSANGVEVETSAGLARATHVVDTRPPSSARLAQSTMFQCFLGRELTLPTPLADQDAVELMTDMRTDAAGFAFTYLLPLSPTRALVEVTRFARRPVAAAILSADLDTLLAARGWTGAAAHREEQAVLPMGLPPPDDPTVPGVTLAGTSAGALRAASGYGFLRIQAWADRCARAIATTGRPVGHPPEPALRRWMDAVFLRVLTAEPERAPECFLRLAKLRPRSTLVRFLSDKANAVDLARIVAALPPSPFLRAIRPTSAKAARA